MSLRSKYGNGNLVYFDPTISPPLGSSPWEQFYNLAQASDPGSIFAFDDDFTSLSTGANTRWQVVKGTGGTIALVTSGLGGQIQVPTAASSNDYQALFSQQPIFLLAANKPIVFEFNINVTEAATNKASWFCGLTDTPTTGFLANTGLPPSSYSGAVFYKTKNAMTVNFQTSNSSTQNTISTLFTATTGVTYVLGAILNPNDGVTGQVTPFVSTIVSGVRTLVGIGAAQNLTLASLGKMYLGFGLYAGSGSAETITADYAFAKGVR